MKKILKTLFISSVFAFAFFSCSKNSGQLDMPEFERKEFSPRVEWSLVTVPYVACRKEAAYDSPSIASFRKGEIHEIKGNRTVLVDGEKEVWYALEEGWVPSTSVKVYSNKLKAEQAKKSLAD